MQKSVIILGAKGRFGRAATEVFRSRGWRVTALARDWSTVEQLQQANYVTASAFDRNALIQACEGHDVIINAINPPYEEWENALPGITKNVIAAGIACHATVMIPGNVYNYGKELPAHLNEKTPHIANTKKGRLRIEMEQAYREAGKNGLHTIVLRGGDFIEGKDTGNWFETYITNKLDKGQVMYPGPLDQTHSWAYLPDMARAMVELADSRKKFSAFEEFGFKGYAITGSELIRALESASRRKLKAKPFPWAIVRMTGLFSKQVREVREMRYLWNRPHEIDDTKLLNALPEFQPTPLEVAMRQVIGSTQSIDTNSVTNSKPVVAEA